MKLTPGTDLGSINDLALEITRSAEAIAAFYSEYADLYDDLWFAMEGYIIDILVAQKRCLRWISQQLREGGD